MAFAGTIRLPASVAGTAFWYLIFSTSFFFCFFFVLFCLFVVVVVVIHIHLSIFPHLHKHGSCPHTQ